MIRSSTYKNLIQPVMVRTLTCHHRFLNISAPVPTCHDRFLNMQGSVPTCKDPFHHISSSVPSCRHLFLRRRSPLRLEQPSSSITMYNRLYNTETTTKAHYEKIGGIVDENVKLTHPQIFVCHGLFLSMSSSVPACHDLFLNMLVSVP